MDVLNQTCSAGVSAQRSWSPQGGHGGRAAHPLHRQLAVRGDGGARAGQGGVLEPGRGRGESWRGGRQRGRESDVACIFPRLLLENGQLRQRERQEERKRSRPSHDLQLDLNGMKAPTWLVFVALNAAAALLLVNTHVKTFTRSCVALCNTSWLQAAVGRGKQTQKCHLVFGIRTVIFCREMTFSYADKTQRKSHESCFFCLVGALVISRQWEFLCKAN